MIFSFRTWFSSCWVNIYKNKTWIAIYATLNINKTFQDTCIYVLLHIFSHLQNDNNMQKMKMPVEILHFLHHLNCSLTNFFNKNNTSNLICFFIDLEKRHARVYSFGGLWCFCKINSDNSKTSFLSCFLCPSKYLEYTTKYVWIRRKSFIYRESLTWIFRCNNLLWNIYN